MERKAKKPQYQQDNRNCPKHAHIILSQLPCIQAFILQLRKSWRETSSILSHRLVHRLIRSWHMWLRSKWAAGKA